MNWGKKVHFSFIRIKIVNIENEVVQKYIYIYIEIYLHVALFIQILSYKEICGHYFFLNFMFERIEFDWLTW